MLRRGRCAGIYQREPCPRVALALRIDQDRSVRRVPSLTARGLTASPAGTRPCRAVCAERRRWRGRAFGDRLQPYLLPTIEFFDRSAMLPEIAELWQQWPDIDPGTARLIRAALMSRNPQRLRLARGMLAARVELARAMR